MKHPFEPVQDYRQITDAAARIRALRAGFITNFYTGEERCRLLIRHGVLQIAENSAAALILQADAGFSHLGYFAADINALDNLLLTTQTIKQPLVADLIGRATDLHSTVATFERNGFKPYTSLVRLSRSEGLDEPQTLNPQVVFAEPEQTDAVAETLAIRFDPYSEQIPLRDEIRHLIDNKRVLVWMTNDKIDGLVVFEINGLTSHLRYWFVDPKMRDQKTGSALLRRFFHECRNTKRQILWVNTLNANAIERYAHYGFRAETMTDIIMKRI